MASDALITPCPLSVASTAGVAHVSSARVYRAAPKDVSPVFQSMRDQIANP
jgi:hypothetical protein